MKKKTNNDKKNFLWNIIGLSAYSFISFFLLVIVNRCNGTDEAGIFTYAFSICNLFFYVALYFNRTYQISNSKKYPFNSYLTTRIVTAFLSFIILLFFSIISGFDSYKLIIIMLLMLFRVVDAISDCFYGYIQSKERLYQVGISYFFKSFLGILLFLLVDIYTHNIIISIITLVVVNLIIFVLYDIHCYKKVSEEKIKLDTSKLKNILFASLAVFIFSFISVYLANLQKYVITYFASNEIQTIFGILIMPATMLSLIGNYLLNPFITKLNNYKENSNYKDYFKLSMKIIGVIILIGIVGTIFCNYLGIQILNIIYQINLDIYKNMLVLIIIGSIFAALGMILSNLLTILNENKKQVLIYFISSIFSTILCVVLVKKDVIKGATLSYLYGQILNFTLFLILYLKKIYKLNKVNNDDLASKHTFVICAYKVQPTLEECVKSLLNQTVKSEVIISTSTPNDFIKGIAKKYNVKLVINKEKSSHIKDFCFAYEQAKTKYVTLAHQDDIYFENFAFEVIKAMDKCKNPIIAFTDCYEIKNEKIIKRSKLLVVKRMLNYPIKLFKKSKWTRLRMLSLGNAIIAPSVTYNKEVVTTPVVETKFKSNSDWLTWIELAKLNGEFVYVNKPLLGRRIHEGSLTTKVIENNIMKEETYTIFKMFWPDWMAKIITKVYSSSEKENKINQKET